MSFKCVPQATGLTMGDPKPKRNGHAQRHRHNGFGWCLECMEERATLSATVDRTLTHTNDYHDGPRSARKFWAAFEEEIATEHSSHYVDKNGVARTRAFRKDGVPLVGTILNPPDEVWSVMSKEERDRFVDDHLSVMEEFEPRLFSRSHIRAHVTHNDEGFDRHILYDTFDDDGKCWGHLLDAKLLHDLCEYYPQAMRERGWDLEDLDVTDWERMKTDEEYAAERREKLRQGRLNTNEYIRKTNQAAAEEATKVRIAQEEATAAALQRQLTAMQETAKETAARDIAVAERVDAEAARDAAREDEFEARQRQSSADRSAAAVRRRQEKAERAAADAREQAAKEMEQARARSQQMMIAARNDAEAYRAYVFEEAEREADLRVEDASLVADTLSGDAATILDDFADRRSEALEAIADARTAAERFADKHSHSRYVDMIVSFIERVPDMVERHFPDRSGSFRRFWEGTVMRIAGTFADEFVRGYDPEPEHHEPGLDGFVTASELSAKRLSQVDLDAMQAMVDEIRAMAAARPSRPHKSGHGVSKSRIRVQQQQAQRSRNRSHGGPQLGR